MPDLLYRGPSLLDGDEILVLASGKNNISQNIKTGPMIQTWILRADVKPSEAVKTQADSSVCGDCIHRGATPKERSCYVIPFMGPDSVWRAFQKQPQPIITNLTDYGNLEIVRIGAYGDPAAVPTKVWKQLTKKADGYTGYTHQWRTCDPDLQQFCMASVDTMEEYLLATAMGWRTYRVRTPEETKDNMETYCPSDKGVQCYSCLACSGKNRGQNNIVIDVHGADWIKNNFAKATA